MSFRQNLNKAAPHSYELIFPQLPVETSMAEKNQLVLNIHSTVIPALTLSEQELPWQGGKAKTFSGEITFEPWFVHFLVDSDFTNWRLMYNWITFINNNKNRYSKNNVEYKVDASLKITDNFEKTVMTIKFVNVWLNNLGEVALTHKEGEETLNSTANFSYDRYEITDLT